MADIDFNVSCWYGPYCKLRSETPDCRRTCQMYMHMNYLIMNCGMPNASKYLKNLKPKNRDLKAYRRLNDIKANVVDFVEQGQNLFLYSNVGQNGKTSWSLKIMYKYFHEIWAGSPYEPRGYFLYVPDFIDNARSFQYKDSEEYKNIDKLLKTVDLVIWDNITMQRLSENDQNLLNKYINKRFMENKANIFNGTFDYSNTDIKNALFLQVGSVLASKLNCCEKVEILGTYI